MLTPDMVGLFIIALVVFVYGYSLLVRRSWPHGHPWSGLAFLFQSAGIFVRGNSEMTGRSNIYSILCYVAGFSCMLVWIFCTQWKSRSTETPGPR